MRLNWILIVSATALIYILSVIGGFIIAMAIGGPNTNPAGFGTGVAVSNFVLMLVGMILVGSLARARRWAHIGIVVIGIWLTGLLNIAFLHATVGRWLLTFPIIAVIGAISGGISALLSLMIRQGNTVKAPQ